MKLGGRQKKGTSMTWRRPWGMETIKISLYVYIFQKYYLKIKNMDKEREGVV